jgi:hypothetical protein
MAFCKQAAVGLLHVFQLHAGAGVMLDGACIASYEQSTVQLVCTAVHALLKDLCVD